MKKANLNADYQLTSWGDLVQISQLNASAPRAPRGLSILAQARHWVRKSEALGFTFLNAGVLI